MVCTVGSCPIFNGENIGVLVGWGSKPQRVGKLQVLLVFRKPDSSWSSQDRIMVGANFLVTKNPHIFWKKINQNT